MRGMTSNAPRNYENEGLTDAFVLQAVLKRYPELAGRVVLEDQPSVLAGALSTKGVEKVGLDFFKEQPVKNARIYYIRNVLHSKFVLSLVFARGIIG